MFSNVYKNNKDKFKINKTRAFKFSQIFLVTYLMYLIWHISPRHVLQLASFRENSYFGSSNKVSTLQVSSLCWMSKGTLNSISSCYSKLPFWFLNLVTFGEVVLMDDFRGFINSGIKEKNNEKNVILLYWHNEVLLFVFVEATNTFGFWQFGLLKFLDNFWYPTMYMIWNF